jgi:hypothetical protein
MWLDDARGNLIDWTTQRWVQATGRRVALADHPWLDGPIGKPTGIGTSFFETYTHDHNLRMARGQPCGLLPNVQALHGPDCDVRALSPDIAHFYEATSEYEIDVWSQWSGVFRPFGWALAVLFSRRLQQMNVPLSGLDTSRGMTSEVAPVVDPVTNNVLFSAWVRELVGTGHVIYAGAYSICSVPDYPAPCVRVVFPLPNGNAIVVLRPVVQQDGSLLLISEGKRFGSPGFYFTVHGRDGVVWARHVRSFRERIHVYALNGEVRTDHVLTLWRAPFLRLHYRLRLRRHTAKTQTREVRPE